jgi:hypothetical protein
MKRALWLTALALTLLALAGIALARTSGATMTVTPSDMKDGETKTYTDDGKTITIRREGDTTHVKIEGAGQTRTLSITKSEEGTIRIDRDGVPGSARTFVVGPERRRIIIDGKPLGDLPMGKLNGLPGDAFEGLPRQQTQSWYVCPKDHTTLRVPEGKESDSFKCPVDGTTMEKRKGRGFSFYFDDGSFESNDL